jgi:type I restriction enzyme S subunit
MFKEYRVSQIGEVVGGGTPSTKIEEYWNGDIPWISPKDLTDYNSVYISYGENYITKKGLNKSGTRLLPENTVLLSSRAPIGYVALAANPICTNQGFKNIICNEKLVNP